MRAGNLTQQVADELLHRVVVGVMAPGSELPPEGALAEELGVSRLTVREALKTLQSQGVVRTVRGHRGVVNPVAQWTSIAAVIQERHHSLGGAEVSRQLVEMRRVIEVGAAALAAQRCDADDLARLAELVDAMAAASQRQDVDVFVAADIAFHDVIFAATRNDFMRLVFEPLHQVLLERRRETSAVAQVQANAVGWHREIAKALGAHDVAAASEAMTGHMDQTQRDLDLLVLRH